MAVAAVMGAVSATTATLAGTAIGASFFTHFLITTAMGAALNALSPKPSVGTGGYSIAGESGAALDHQIIYGKTKVGGVRVYDSTTGTNNLYLHRILAFAGHEINSYEQIYLNDELVTIDGSGNVTSPTRYSGYVRIKRYYGTTTQSADANLISDTATLTDGKWTTLHTLTNIAYIYVRFKYNSDVFPNGVPTLSAVIKGAKVYDPRTGLTAWSDNPALCLRDYLTKGYGLSVDTSRISDTHFTTAANICDQSVTTTITGTTTTVTENRYTCNGAFLTSYSPNQIISDLITSMGGLFWYSGGFWKTKAAAWTSPVKTLTQDDLRSGVSVSTRHSRRDNFNSVKGTFRGLESDWQEADYPTVKNQLFLDDDNGLENIADYSLPFTSSSITAQRIAKVFLYRNREQISVSASWGLKAFSIEVGDIVNLTLDRFGWSSKPFEVLSWTFGLTNGLDIQVNLELREISQGVFQDVDGSAFELNNTTLPSPYLVPSVGINPSLTSKSINESLVNVLQISVTADPDAESNIKQVEAQYKLTSSSSWISVGTGDLGLFEVLNIQDGTYDIRARATNYFDVKGAWQQYSSFIVSASLIPPQDITDFTANLHGGSATFQWTPVADTDLSYYKIRQAIEETGAVWANSVVYADKVSRPGNSITLPAKPGTYMIRAYDKTGNASSNFDSAVIPVTALETYTTNLTRTESTTFTGTKVNCSVVGGTLRLTTYTSAPSTGVYTFSTYVDTGAVRKVRARVDMALTRYDNSPNLFDSLSGNFDSLLGLFDDLTGGTNDDDINVVTFISTTNDNPAGTPTWSAYKEFKSGDFYGRAFRFAVTLKSSGDGITPAISSLVARVSY